jgi:hypothetical protein
MILDDKSFYMNQRVSGKDPFEAKKLKMTQLHNSIDISN